MGKLESPNWQGRTNVQGYGLDADGRIILMRNADLGMRNELGSKGAREYEGPGSGVQVTRTVVLSYQRTLLEKR